MIPPYPAPLATAPARDAGDDTWKRHARLWSLVTPPLRPAPEDVAVYRTAVEEWMASTGWQDPDLLVLGVTPELCGMAAAPHGRVIAMDMSAIMIEAVWPGRFRPRDAVARADWRAMPLAWRSIDIVLGDNALCPLSYPAGQAAVCEELLRVLRPGGRWVTRCFVRPDEPETVADVISDLERGAIGNIHVLKWRLAMAIQPSSMEGVIVSNVWDVFHAEWPDLDALAESQGWPIEQVRCVEAYRGNQACYTFPTFRELVASLAAGGFEIVRVARPTYELGERCPILELKARDTGT